MKEVREWIYAGEQDKAKLLKKRSFHIALGIYVKRTQVNVTNLSITH